MSIHFMCVFVRGMSRNNDFICDVVHSSAITKVFQPYYLLWILKLDGTNANQHGIANPNNAKSTNVHWITK